MFRTSLLAAICTCIAHAAPAQTISASDPASVVTALQGLGYKAQLEVDEEGDPKIRSATSGANFTIFFYGCEANVDCIDLLLSVGFAMEEDKPTLDAINNWNTNKLTGKAYLDDDGDPNIEHFVVGVADMSLDNFETTLNRWNQAVGGFTNFIDW